jgi:proliferating cell nuclear antigen
MRLKTIQANSIKSVFEVLKDLLNDVNFIFDKSGVRITTLDTAHVTFVNMFLEASNFEVYECPTKIIAGMNIANTFKILKMIGNNDTLTMICESNENMDIIIENTQKKSKTVFNLKLLDINEESYDLNSLNFDSITIMQSVNLLRIVRDMYNFSTLVNIERKSNMISFSCKGDFVDQRTEIECQDTFDDEIFFTYSLKYINMFTKATNICANVAVHQNKDGAIMFRYSIANLGDIDFYLAPNTDS